ncbi:hypothetical protein BGY98DRAFT_997810 [Russula aff. rugulosa BPL654]|nr:hypothetical protein BGY98DRAFT_997810 [Russula aff. rugulosa BPL654]
MSDSVTGLLFEMYETNRETAYSNLLVGIVFGAYVVIYGTSLYILLCNNGVLRSAPRLFMLVVSTLTFVLGLIALVLETSLAFQNFARELSSSSSSSLSLWSTHRTNTVVALCATITYLVFLLTDLVCAWRAAVLWNYDRRVLAILALFVLGTITAGGADLGIYLHTTFKSSDQPLQQGTGVKQEHRRKRDVLSNHLSRNSAAIRVEKVLAMLVESGFIYCCIWGLYPTIIFIFVVLRKSPTHTITKQHASAHFSDRPYPTTEETPVRIPMSIMFTPPEESHNTESDLTIRPSPSPSSPHLRDNKQLLRVGSS